MNRNILIVAFAFLVSTPVFAVVPFNSGGPCICPCEAADDFSSASCAVDCDCTVNCNGITCTASCECLTTEEAEEELQHDDELIFDEITENMDDIDDTGMMGTTEGTFADYEEIYVLDGETAITNEVDITPGWCD